EVDGPRRDAQVLADPLDGPPFCVQANDGEAPFLGVKKLGKARVASRDPDREHGTLNHACDSTVIGGTVEANGAERRQLESGQCWVFRLPFEDEVAHGGWQETGIVLAPSRGGAQARQAKLHEAVYLARDGLGRNTGFLGTLLDGLTEEHDRADQL